MGRLCYYAWVLGESPTALRACHESSVRRAKSFALAIHIPVVLWAISGYAISALIFSSSTLVSIACAVICAAMIYLVERLIIATPKCRVISGARVVLGVCMGVLGASVIDLIIFDQEISHELRIAGTQKIQQEYAPHIRDRADAAENALVRWQVATAAAQCEANGTCGTREKNVGPVYQELSRYAEVLRSDYVDATAQLNEAVGSRDKALEEWKNSDRSTIEAGLLMRLEALHGYLGRHPLAATIWLLFFLVVLSFELVVVCMKSAWGRTVDDDILDARESISRIAAQRTLRAAESPCANAYSLLAAHYD